MGTQLLKLAKDVNPEVVTVVGNVHATFSYQEILKEQHSVVDYVVRGEGEITLPALLDCLNAGGDPAELELLRSLGYVE